MATNTERLNLIKPSYTERADIGVINSNMDTIDAAIHRNETSKLDKPSGVAPGKFLQVGLDGQAVWGDGIGEATVEARVQEWLDENLTPGTTVIVDASLTQAGVSADAKATGDAINDLRDSVEDAVDRAEQAATKGGYMDFYIDENGHLIYRKSPGMENVSFELVEGRLIAIWQTA